MGETRCWHTEIGTDGMCLSCGMRVAIKLPDFTMYGDTESLNTIKADRDTARASEAMLRVALEGIRDSSHCAYRDSGPPEDRQYRLGVADGHRCASGMANVALSGSSGEWLERHDEKKNAEVAMLREGIVGTTKGFSRNALIVQMFNALLNACPSEWLERQLSEAVAAERERAEKAEATWRCFHCGFKTDDAKVAEAHFGDVDEEEPICRSWERMNADEKVGAFQGALQEIASEQEENSQLRSKLEKAEAERDGLVARLSEAIDWLAALRRNHPFGKENSQWAFDTAEWASDDIGDQAPALARITAEARRKALLEVAEAALEKYGASPTQHWLAKLAQGVGNA